MRKFFKQLFCRHLAFTFVSFCVIQDDTGIDGCFVKTQCTACEKIFTDRYTTQEDDGK
jgi:hypothetical protein